MNEQNSISAIEARLAAVEQKLSDAQPEKEVSLHFKIEGGEVFINEAQIQKCKTSEQETNNSAVTARKIADSLGLRKEQNARIKFWLNVKAAADANLKGAQALKLQGSDSQKWHLSAIANLASQLQEQVGYLAYPSSDIAE